MAEVLDAVGVAGGNLVVPPHGVTEKFFDASSVVDNAIGPAIYQDYLGAALASGRFRPAPPAQVVGVGLQHVQAAFDLQRKGVSAAKIVVALD